MNRIEWKISEQNLSQELISADSRWHISKTQKGTEKPTFSPSLLSQGRVRCHMFVRDGMIQFLGDSEHSLRGQTVEIPDWEESLGIEEGRPNV